MRLRFVGLISMALLTGTLGFAQDASTPPQEPSNPSPGAGGRMGRGGWMGGMAGRGVAGTVSEVAADHYTIKTMTGETYTIHYSANTRILMAPAQRAEGGGMRQPPEAIKATDIHVGDAVMAMGEIDAGAKSVGAMSVIKIDPARAREMREMEANFGKTWLMGRVTAVNETKVTLQSQVDNAEHIFVADENTSFRRRREPVTLADIQVGANVRVEGAVKQGVFVATSVMVMGPPMTGGPAQREGPPPQ